MQFVVSEPELEMRKIRFQPRLLVIAMVTSLTDVTFSMTSFKPVIDPISKLVLCATDPPTIIVPLADVSVGVPAGIPDVIVCGFGCAGYVGCSSYNYRKPRTAPAQCELYTANSRNCSTMITSSNEQCHHYEVSGSKQRCLPPICDSHCVSSCSQRGAGKCDSQCINGYRLAENFSCQRISCPANYTYITYANAGTYYQFVTDEQLPWSNATSNCAADGAYLARIDSADEQTALVTFINSRNNGHSVWISGCRLLESTFVWSSHCNNDRVPLNAITQIMTYTSWSSPGEPSPVTYFSSGGCIKMDKGSSYNWVAYDCENSRNYICEYG